MMLWISTKYQLNKPVMFHTVSALFYFSQTLCTQLCSWVSASVVSTWMGALYTLQNGGSVGSLVFGKKPSSGRVLWGRGLSVLSGDDGGCRQEKRESCCVRSDRVVVIHSWCECCAQHPERTHVKLWGEASLRGVCGRKYKRELILFL
jgi:hypothetical protein